MKKLKRGIERRQGPISWRTWFQLAVLSMIFAFGIEMFLWFSKPRFADWPEWTWAVSVYGTLALVLFLLYGLLRVWHVSIYRLLLLSIAWPLLPFLAVEKIRGLQLKVSIFVAIVCLSFFSWIAPQKLSPLQPPYYGVVAIRDGRYPYEKESEALKTIGGLYTKQYLVQEGKKWAYNPMKLSDDLELEEFYFLRAGMAAGFYPAPNCQLYVNPKTSLEQAWEVLTIGPTVVLEILVRGLLRWFWPLLTVGVSFYTTRKDLFFAFVSDLFLCQD